MVRGSGVHSHNECPCKDSETNICVCVLGLDEGNSFETSLKNALRNLFTACQGGVGGGGFSGIRGTKRGRVFSGLA